MAFPVRRRVASSNVAGSWNQHDEYAARDSSEWNSQYSSITLTPRLDGDQFSRPTAGMPYWATLGDLSDNAFDVAGDCQTSTLSHAKLQPPVLGRADSEATLFDSSPPALKENPWPLSRYQTLLSAHSDQQVFRRPRKWTTFKWCLVWSASSVFVYGTATMVCALLTWFRTWDLAEVMLIADSDVLILTTIAGSIIMLTALTGMIGTMLNSRPILAVYAVLMWSALVAIFIVGRISYRRSTFALDRKLNLSWSRYYTTLGRLVIQNSFHCCGYYTPLHEATQSETCSENVTLPGCKGSLYKFERENLKLIWSMAFALVPLHIINIIVAVLCANHVTVTSTLDRRQGSGDDAFSEIRTLLHSKNYLRKPAMSRTSSNSKFREDRVA